MPFALSDIVLNSGDGAAATIHQITSLQNSQGVTLNAVKGTGGVAPITHIQGDAEPIATITTTDTSILGLNSNLWLAKGYCASAAASIVPFNKRADCGVFDAASVHVALSCDKVYVVPTSISGQGSGAVQINGEIRYLAPTSDRSTNPVTKLSSRSLTAATFQEQCQLDDVYIRGVLLPGVTGFTFTPGFTVTRDDYGGYPTAVYLTSIESTFEFTVDDIDRAMTAITASSTTSGGGTVVYLAKQVSEARVAANATTTHKSITADSGVELTETISHSEGQNGTGTIKISVNNPNNADSGALVTVATDIAIP